MPEKTELLLDEDRVGGEREGVFGGRRTLNAEKMTGKGRDLADIWFGHVQSRGSQGTLGEGC